MGELPTIADLIKAGVVTSEHVDMAVVAVVANSRIGRFAIGKGLYLDLTRIIRRTSVAETMRDPNATEGLKRGVLRKAILQARPAKE